MNRIYGVVAVVMVLGAGSTPANAQMCYSDCESCGTGKWNGDGSLGGYNEASCTTSTDCGQCAIICPECAGLLDAVKSSSLSSLKAAAAKYGSHILLHSGRRLLILKGSDCSPDGLGTVIFLSRRQTAALSQPGVPSLTSFLATRQRERSQLPVVGAVTGRPLARWWLARFTN